MQTPVSSNVRGQQSKITCRTVWAGRDGWEGVGLVGIGSVAAAPMEVVSADLL